MKTPNSTADATSDATIAVLPQPSSFPRSSASTSRNSAAISVAWPAQSIRRGVGSRPSPTRRQVTHSATAPIGTLIRKIALHPNSAVSAPPMNGPIANDAPIAMP